MPILKNSGKLHIFEFKSIITGKTRFKIYPATTKPAKSRVSSFDKAFDTVQECVDYYYDSYIKIAANLKEADKIIGRHCRGYPGYR